MVGDGGEVWLEPAASERDCKAGQDKCKYRKWGTRLLLPLYLIGRGVAMGSDCTNCWVT